MNSKRPIISLCIPTNGIVKWVIPTVESIYRQGVEMDTFEVVITDNGQGNALAEAVKRFQYPNLHYFRSSEQGFMNQIFCFKKSCGIFCKMINHRACLLPGVLQEMISLVSVYSSTKPILFFSNHVINNEENILNCESADEFVKTLHYWVSWSSGVGIWDKDKDRLGSVIPNEMFPHICLLFDLRGDAEYVIWNKSFFEMQDESGKGGYGLVHTFAVVLNDIFTDLKERVIISKGTYSIAVRQTYSFLSSLYSSEVIDKNSKHTFIIRNVKESVSKYYGIRGYYRMVITQHILWFARDVLKQIRYEKDASKNI